MERNIPNDFVSRYELVKHLVGVHDGWRIPFGYTVEDEIINFPAADVVEVRHGCWIIASKLHPLPWDTDPLDWDRYDKKTHSEWEDYYECSECHKGEYDIKPQWHYCPNCGAKMDGGQEE